MSAWGPRHPHIQFPKRKERLAKVLKADSLILLKYFQRLITFFKVNLAVLGLSCPVACGIFVPGWDLSSLTRNRNPHTLGSRFLTTGPPGSPQTLFCLAGLRSIEESVVDGENKQKNR